MKKNINIVLIGVLTISSIILALPFTPLRNSFQGITGDAVNKVFASIGVDWRGKIVNARKLSYSYQSEASELSLISIETKSKASKLRKGGSAGGPSEDYMVSFGDNGNDVRSAVGLTGSFATSGIISSTSEDQQSIVGGAVSFSTKAGSASNTTLTQSGSTSLQSSNGDNNGTGGGTHPGVDPDTPPTPCVPPPSLPMGNGTSILLSLVGIFSIIKARKIA